MASTVARNRRGPALALAFAALLLALLGVALLTSIAAASQTWADVVGVVVDLATILAILVGAAWAFYVFVLGRSFSTSVRVELRLERLVERTDAQDQEVKDALISVKLRNAGQTRVDRRDRCLISFEPITEKELLDLASLRPLTNLLRSNERSYELFHDLVGLEPGEEIEEDVLFAAAGHPAFKVQVRFKGYVGPTPVPTAWRLEGDWRKDVTEQADLLRRRLNWATRKIVDTRGGTEEGEGV